MIRALYEKLTGRPWTTTRCMSAEYGPPPGAVYAHQLAKFTDAELIAHGDHILTTLRNQDTSTTRHILATLRNQDTSTTRHAHLLVDADQPVTTP